MDYLQNVIYYIVPFILLLSVLVFVHEFGHFIVARISGVKVTAFSIGFGKVLWSKKDKHDTVWQISAVPLGGYCQFLGDADASSSTTDDSLAESLSEEDKKQAFMYQSPWKKLAIVCAGPLFNYFFAILLFIGIFYFIGEIIFPPIVGEVIANSPAEKALLQKNDRILKINGETVSDFADISVLVETAVDRNVQLEILREGNVLTIPLVLEEMDVKEADGTTVHKTMIGIKSLSNWEVKKEPVGLLKAVDISLKKTWITTTATLRGLAQMISGERSSEEIGGIIRIAEMSGDISKSEKGASLNFLMFMALLSINLGLINFFPIPVLDGGHIVIYTIEILIGREVNETIKSWLFKIGLSLIIALMIFATWNDIVHLFNRWFS